MTFPTVPRVLYAHNVLDTVFCQLRFPQILRIDAEEPVAFQERIRSEYPLLNRRAQPDLSSALPPEVAKLIGERLPLPMRQSAYDFGAADNAWRVTLTGTFLALRTTRYLRWDDFRSRLTPLVTALIEIYQPAFFSRIGLQYRNVVNRSALGLKDVPWRDLIQPHVAGVLASNSVAEEMVVGINTEDQFTLGENTGRVVLRHGLGRLVPSGEKIYLLDADFFNEPKIEVLDAIQQLEGFNREARGLLRWCITERLHNAMGPQPSDG